MRATGEVTTKVADEDLERALRNWARWVVSSGADLHSAFPLAEIQGRGRRAEASIPIINGEAVEMDSIIEAMPVRYMEVIRVWYVRELPPAAAARRCRCCLQTIYNRLETAWSIIHQERVTRMEAAARLGAQYRASVTAARAARGVP